MWDTFHTTLPEETLFCSEGRFQSETERYLAACPNHLAQSLRQAQYQDIRSTKMQSVQCTLRVYLQRIIMQFTNPSIHATEAGFLQSGRYQLNYDESNFDFRQLKKKKNDNFQSVLTDPEEHPTSYPTNYRDSSIRERLHRMPLLKNKKPGHLITFRWGGCRRQNFHPPRNELYYNMIR